jgi:hypothetical protein
VDPGNDPVRLVRIALATAGILASGARCSVATVTRLVISLAVLVAVVAGAGSAVNWVNDHVGDFVVWMTAGMIALGLGIGWNRARARTGVSRYRIYTRVTVGGWLINAFVLDPVLPDDINGYIFAAVALTPLGIEIFLRDSAARARCPDCREEIRVDANVCKRCGFRLGAEPQGDAVGG